MCLAAIHWARIDRVYYAATAEDAALAGFDDRWIAEQLVASPTEAQIARIHLDVEHAGEPFRLWAANPNRVAY